MAKRKPLLGAINLMLGKFGYQAVQIRKLYDWQRRPAERSRGETPLPDGAAQYLTADNPRLKDLTARYAKMDARATTPLIWRPGHMIDEDLRYFRGDTPYVWQLRGGFAELHYVLTTYYVQQIDRLGLLDKLAEDGAFGALTFSIAGRIVSRDLLDSIVEIDFLDRHLTLSKVQGFNILDIGAGYGRLACRALQALPGIGTYFCTDAVAASTFVSEHYLRFRGLADRAQVVPLDELDRLSGADIGLAINIHSFSECTVDAIDWWIARIAKLGVPRLMVVPNPGTHAGARLQTNTGEDFQPIIEKHGYGLIAKEPKYADPAVQRYGIYPSYYYLFALTPGS